MTRGAADWRRMGANASVTIAGEMAFVSRQSRRVEREKSVGQTPALLIRMSRWPCWALTSATAAAMEASEVMSSWTREMAAPGVEDWMDEMAFWPFSHERLPMMQ